MTMPTGVFRREAKYWLRVLIPDDLLHLYPRTSKGLLATDRHRASLRTADKAEARIKALALRAEFEHEFNEKRKGLQPAPVRPAPPLQTILAEAVYAQRLALDDRLRKDKNQTIGFYAGAHSGPIETRDLPMVSRFEPIPGATVAARIARNQQSLQTVRNALASGDLQVMLPIANNAAKALGFAIDWDSDEGEATLEACLRSYARAVDAVTRKDLGEVVETPELPKLSQDAPGATQATPGSPAPAYRVIRDLLPLWIQKTKPTAEAQSDVNLAWRLLDQSGIPCELATLRGSHGATFRDWLRDTPARAFLKRPPRIASERSRPC